MVDRWSKRKLWEAEALLNGVETDGKLDLVEKQLIREARMNVEQVLPDDG